MSIEGPVEMREFARREGFTWEPGTVPRQPSKPVDCIVFYEDQAPLKKIPIPRHLDPKQLAERIKAAKDAGLSFEGSSEADLLYIEKRRAPDVYVTHYKGPIGDLYEWIYGIEQITDTGPQTIKPGHTRAWIIGMVTGAGQAVPDIDMNKVKEYLHSKDVKFNEVKELAWDKFRVIDETRRQEVSDFDLAFASKLTQIPAK